MLAFLIIYNGEWVFFHLEESFLQPHLIFLPCVSPKPELFTHTQILYSADTHLHCSSKARPSHQLFERGCTKEKLWDAESTIDSSLNSEIFALEMNLEKKR